MDWKAFLQTLITAAVNTAIGVLVSHATGSTTAGVATMAGGTAVAHGLRSPFHKL